MSKAICPKCSKQLKFKTVKPGLFSVSCPSCRHQRQIHIYGNEHNEFEYRVTLTGTNTGTVTDVSRTDATSISPEFPGQIVKPTEASPCQPPRKSLSAAAAGFERQVLLRILRICIIGK